MANQPVRPEIYASVDVAVYTVANSEASLQLATVLAADSQNRLHVPSVELARRASLEELCKQAVADVMAPSAGDRVPGPLIWQTEAFRDVDTNVIRIGHIAVVNAASVGRTGRLIPVEGLSKMARGLTVAEKRLLELGITSLRDRLADTSIKRPERARARIFPVLARLVDPNAFTLDQVHVTFEAIVGERDPRNLTEDIKHLAGKDFIGTKQWHTTAGRRAKIWRMSDELIDLSGPDT